jgi:hypothetical protein
MSTPLKQGHCHRSLFCAMVTIMISPVLTPSGFSQLCFFCKSSCRISTLLNSKLLNLSKNWINKTINNSKSNFLIMWYFLINWGQF